MCAYVRYTASIDRMELNHELEGMQNKAVLVCCKSLSWEVLRKTTRNVKVVNCTAKTGTKNAVGLLSITGSSTATATTVSNGQTDGYIKSIPFQWGEYFASC